MVAAVSAGNYANAGLGYAGYAGAIAAPATVGYAAAPAISGYAAAAPAISAAPALGLGYGAGYGAALW